MDAGVELSIEGRLLLPTGLVDGCIGVSGGRIVAIKRILEGEVHHDLSGCVVVPAAVDMHVHFRQPGDERKGTFGTESRAAAFGGVTTVADMPNNTPPAVDERSWADKWAGIEGESFVDYALYMGMSADRDPQALGSRTTGLFKLYVASTTGDLLVRDRQAWVELLARALEVGGRVVVHAEDQEAIDASDAEDVDLEGHDAKRPPLGEAAAVDAVTKVAMSTGGPGHCHVAHLSCDEALRVFLGSHSSAEVTPHHLFLDKRAEELGARGKVNPPLRSDSDRAALWAALQGGYVPIVASDHAPHTNEEKSRRFEDAPAGIPGVETMVPLLMTQVLPGRLSVERLVDATSTRPAEFLGLEPRGLVEGREAHLAAYDLHDVREIKAGHLHQRCGYTPYEGMEAVFPRLVVSPSGVLVDDGVFQTSRPAGRYVGSTLEQLSDQA